MESFSIELDSSRSHRVASRIAQASQEGPRYLCRVTASFSEHDPHRMVHTYGLHKGPA